MSSCTIESENKLKRNTYEYEKVLEVIDGDTFKIENSIKVRLIGIDSEELDSKDEKERLLAIEAKKFSIDNLENKYVKLVKDISNKDKYGRLLRYVYLEDGIFFNELIVREGLAKIKKYEPDIKFYNILNDAQDLAQEEKLGIWEN
jgi:micrococcal nuclease